MTDKQKQKQRDYQKEYQKEYRKILLMNKKKLEINVKEIIS